MVSDVSKPNDLLRRQRKLRSWTLNDAANALYRLYVAQGEVRERGDINAQMMSVWERGKHLPSPFWQRKLCELYGKSTEELGFIGEREAPERSDSDTAVSALPALPAVLIPTYQAPDHFYGLADGTPEQQLGAWLVLSAGDLVHLLEEDWSVEEVLATLKIVLKGVQAMPMVTRQITRRRLLQLGAAALVGGIPIPSGNHVSFEERVRLHSALGESIGAGWKLFHTASTAQVLAVGQAQLYLIQQASLHLYPSVRPLLYSAVYRLIGATLHFQGCYEEAFQAHEQAYTAAWEGMDMWNMAQSRSWQAYGLHALGRYSEALETTDAALRLISQQQDTESIRLRARLLAFGAENAAILENGREAQSRLDASEALLEYLPGYHEEFDRVSWLQQAGGCALSLKQYDKATERLQQALDGLPASWTLRFVSTSVPLASALTHLEKLEEALAIAKKTLPIVQSLQSPMLILEFTTYLQTELLATFPKEERCQTFVAAAQQQLTLV